MTRSMKTNRFLIGMAILFYFSLLLKPVDVAANITSNLEGENNAAMTSAIRELIQTGEGITDGKSSEAFAWLAEVEKVNNQFPESVVFEYTKSDIRIGKNHGVDTFNSKQKLLGYLYYLKDKVSGLPQKSIKRLIDDGKLISDSKSVEAYYWLANVCEVNQLFVSSNEFEDIQKECRTAAAHDLDVFDSKSKIIGYLGVLLEEVANTSTLMNIVIKAEPNKTEYYYGETFDPTGIIVQGEYKVVTKDGLIIQAVKEEKDYSVDTNTPITHSDNKWEVSVTKEGVTKKAFQQISVLPIVISKSLLKIEIRIPPKKLKYWEGEYFSPKGMVVDAFYSRIWSDYSEDTLKKSRVKYSIKISKALKAKDTSVQISYSEGDYIRYAVQKIVVDKIPRPKIKSTSRGNKKITVSWRRENVKGYQIQYSTDKKFSKKKSINIKKHTTVKAVIKNLSRHKRYYIRMRCYVKSGKNNLYSKWSSTVKVVTK